MAFEMDFARIGAHLYCNNNILAVVEASANRYAVRKAGEFTGDKWTNPDYIIFANHFLCNYSYDENNQRTDVPMTIFNVSEGSEERFWTLMWELHDYSAGVLGDRSIPPTGRKPSPTRDLRGLRAIYKYNTNQCFDHVYMTHERYVWHCVVGPLKGQADVEMCTIYKFDDNQYIFSWREFGLPVSTVFFYNWNQMKTTGKFFAIGDDGNVANTPAAALITKLSMAFYPLDAQPL
jgi:hypothetical protein